MLARPAAGMRVLMTHGGNAMRESICGFLCENGWRERPFGAEGTCDDVADPLLAGCVTASQIAAVFEARETGGMEPPPGLLALRRLVLAGPPNVGKSSLMNRLAGFARSVVHDAPGVTLDVVDEAADVGGYAVRLEDLPGFAASDDALEREAWARAERRLRQAEVVLFVCDASTPWDETAARAARAVADVLAETPRPGPAVLVVLNKADLPGRLADAPWRAFFPGAGEVAVCSLPGGDAADKVGAAVGNLLR